MSKLSQLDRFIRKLNTPSTDEEIKALKRAKKLLKKSNSKDKFNLIFFDINLDTSAYYFYFSQVVKLQINYYYKKR